MDLISKPFLLFTTLQDKSMEVRWERNGLNKEISTFSIVGCGWTELLVGLTFYQREEVNKANSPRRWF